MFHFIASPLTPFGDFVWFKSLWGFIKLKNSTLGFLRKRDSSWGFLYFSYYIAFFPYQWTIWQTSLKVLKTISSPDNVAPKELNTLLTCIESVVIKWLTQLFCARSLLWISLSFDLHIISWFWQYVKRMSTRCVAMLQGNIGTQCDPIIRK